ncbi:von willebrand and RING finger protein [Ceratobasidium sp. AG-Ba]|nr:von willebrand and RING finger protein [Ceratobasidium sp. AG-Ba]
MANRLFAKFSTSSARTPPPQQARSTSEWSVSERPPATMTPGPLPVVSRNDPIVETDEDCIICGESLSFSFRLPGEKPHIVPECGHALHEACFTAVYGPLPSSKMGVLPRKNLGVCGVCRKPIRVGDGDGGKSNKLAALTGMGDKSTTAVYPGRESTVAGPSRFTPTPRSAPTPVPHDPTDDDPIEPSTSANASIRSGGSGGANPDYVVAPAISVRSEFPSITRVHEPTQSITCLITVELASRRGSAPVPGPVIATSPPAQQPPARYASPPPPTPDDVPGPYSYNATPPVNPRFARVAEDLQNRLVDWKGHPMSALGPLQMFDILSVRRDSLVREFYVYLFKEAIICVLEEKKKSLGRLLATGSGTAASFDAASLASGTSSPGFNSNKSVLRLKGRIYIRHIKRLLDTSVAGELSLTIDMEDERLESFILIFRDRSSLEEWRAMVQSLVNAQHAADRFEIQDLTEFGGQTQPGRSATNAGRTRSAATTASSLGADSILHSGQRSTVSSSSSGNAFNARSPEPPQQHYLGPSPHVSPHVSTGPSNTLPPLPHAPMDLIAVVSLPPPNAHASTAQLKLRVIRTTLDFLVASLGSRDRLAFVTFQAGKNGRVRKTPFLSLAKPGSVARLSGFIESMAAHNASSENFNDGQDEFWVKNGKDEIVDVVTAVNHGLDSVLQRKQKNPISGMVLVCDSSDSSRKPQMDLLMARTEAANLPIHSFGFGRSHDPGPLWLISNATSGSYTFVRDWYELRDCVAGCVGGMMSIGVMNLRMHAKVLDDARFRIRKVAGVSGAVVARDGMNVDVVLGALHFGERRELVVELELDNRTQQTSTPSGLENVPPGQSLDATDAFVQRMGLDALDLSETVLGEGMMDAMIDEAPVFEVDGAFFDPGAGKTVSRLAHPVLLTLAIHPPAVASYPRGQGPAQGHGSQPPNQGWSDATIVRRRAELLSHQMIMRAIVFVGRRDYAHAVQLLVGTRTALTNILTTSLPPPTSRQTRKELLTLAAVRTIQSVMGDVQVLIDALEENPDGFNRDWRPFGAQQAMVLRDQMSWTGRTTTEKIFWCADNSIELFGRSSDWATS